jgi:hypothetical protein
MDAISFEERDAEGNVVQKRSQNIREGLYDGFTWFENTKSQNESSVPGDTPPVTEIYMVINRNFPGYYTTNYISIIFTNRCDVYPVLEEHSKVGWVVMVSFLFPSVDGRLQVAFVRSNGGEARGNGL